MHPFEAKISLFNILSLIAVRLSVIKGILFLKLKQNIHYRTTKYFTVTSKFTEKYLAWGTLTERLAFFNVLGYKVMFAVAKIAYLCVRVLGRTPFGDMDDKHKFVWVH